MTGHGQSEGSFPNRTDNELRSTRMGSDAELSCALIRTETVRVPSGTGAVHERERDSIQSSPATRVTEAEQALPRVITRPEPVSLDPAG